MGVVVGMDLGVFGRGAVPSLGRRRRSVVLMFSRGMVFMRGGLMVMGLGWRVTRGCPGGHPDQRGQLGGGIT